ncbi:MAG: Si-specific NAD(P)(+) transhydrogenase [Bryobacterales bacterium]
MQEYDLLVIGSGPAGQKCAIAAAKMGKRAAVVERSMTLGGACLHHGTIPSKTLREAATYLTGLQMRETYGASYRVKERISIQDLTYRTKRVIENEVNIVRDQLIRNYVDVIPGSASFLDAHTVQVAFDDGIRKISAEKIVIAVGSKPTRPAGIQFDDCHIVDSDGLLNLPSIPRNMIFVGAGIIGCEYATIFRTLGSRVTVIDRRERPLDFVDDEIEDALYYQMRDEGVTLRFGEEVLSVSRPSDDKVHVETKSGKQFTSDALMFAAGRVGASSALNLEAIGLETDERGRIKVDEHYRTAVPNIYAVGDVIGFPSLASTSMEQGRIAALHAFGVESSLLSQRLPYGVYTIPEIAMIGPTEEELTKQETPYETGIARFRELSRIQISGGSHGMLKLIFNRESLKLLAVHILGPSSTELIHIGQAVLDHDGSVAYFRDAVFNYPTLAEAYKVAALDGLNKI